VDFCNLESKLHFAEVGDGLDNFAGITGGQWYLVRESEMKAWEEHVANIERDVIGNYDVLVTTTSAISDNRISSWSRDNLITTVIADEAGQATQLETLPLYMIRAQRYCFIGDHLQLPATVHSPAVDTAGYGKSVLERIDSAKYLHLDNKKL